MTETRCPRCDEPIPRDSIDFMKGVAQCPNCGRLSQLRKVAERRPLAEILSRPPDGCEVIRVGEEILIRAGTRSAAGFGDALFSALFVNLIVFILMLPGLVGVCAALVARFRNGLPVDGFGIAMALAGVAILCFFVVFTPFFAAAGVTSIAATVMAVAGRVEVRIGDSEGVVQTGVGFLTWNRRFDPRRVRKVDVGFTSPAAKGRDHPVVTIKAGRVLKFGSLLPIDRLEWLQSVLRSILTESGPEHREKMLQTIHQVHARSSSSKQTATSSSAPCSARNGENNSNQSSAQS